MREYRKAVFMCQLLAGFSLVLSAPGTADEVTPLAQFIQSRSAAAWSEPGTIMQGRVKFVTGSDIWQPGEQFADGSDWLALVCHQTACRLQPAQLTVQANSWQGHYDDSPTAGQTLLFKTAEVGEGNVVVWFATAKLQTWLTPGEVTTWYSPQGTSRPATGKGTLEAEVALPDGSVAELVPLMWTVAAQDRLEPGGDHYSSRYYLQLRSQGTRQMLLGELGTCYGINGITPEEYLRWAGDLDRDGAADYLISYIDGEGPVHLYLSGDRKPGQLVGLSGVYASPPFGGECSGD
ncbi:MAG: hypothetical protein P8103_10420 [Candidatus Thiodiazotropha sp.]|jgi:hypothetical protein